MKYITIKNLVFGLIGVLCLNSCNNDEFLTEANPNELSTDSFWKDNNDLNTGLTAVYSAWTNGDILNIRADNDRSDITWPGFRRPNTDNQFYLQNFNDAAPEINNKWNALYTGIFYANQVIVNGKRLMSGYTDQDQIDTATLIMAQARFLRGFFYFHLYQAYNKGSVPLLDFIPVTGQDFFQPLAPASEIRTFYLADLNYAYENLPPSWDSTGRNTDVGRVKASAAAAILGKSYLYEGDYSTAATFFEDIINNGAYKLALVNNYGDNFSKAGEFNSESILEVSYSTDFKAEQNPNSPEQVSNTFARTFASAVNGGFRVVQPSAPLVSDYKQDPIDPNDPRNLVTVTELDSNGDEVEVTRVRKYASRTSLSIALPDDEDTPYYGNELPAIAAAFNNQEIAYYRKFTNWITVATEADFNPINRSPLNTRLIRLADVYLMYAECLIKGGSNDAGVDEALVYINKVRHRSALQLLGLSGTGEHPASAHNDVLYTANTLMEHLMYKERPLELAVEGMAIRFYDLRRWGVVKARFQDLSQRVYHGVNYVYINRDGNQATKFGTVLVDGPEPTGNTNAEYYDYRQAAVNYTESIHAYYPIPSSETIANPNF